jgi:hypothetical protein
MVAKSGALYASILNRHVAALPIDEHGKLHRWLNGKYTLLLIGLATFALQIFIMVSFTMNLTVS